jgi:hypothetical protein
MLLQTNKKKLKTKSLFISILSNNIILNENNWKLNYRRRPWDFKLQQAQGKCRSMPPSLRWE